MRYPPSSRGRSSSTAILILCVASLMFAGCVSMPKFSAEQSFTDDSFADAGPPVFDDDPALAANRPKAVKSHKRKATKDSGTQKLAGRHAWQGVLAEQKPFAWKTSATSAGKRHIESIAIGQGGYRVLVLGSLAGNDPLAIELTERLAKHVHENQIVLGGIRLKVVRNCNPDGHAELRMENANGVYLNRQFVDSLDVRRDLAKQEPEIRFLLGLLDEDRPQRIIHIRSTSNAQGMIAASAGASEAARDFADWQSFRLVALPGKAAEGTLERYISSGHECEIVTVAIPDDSKREELWQTYGDSLLNLLLAEDFETRKLARQQKSSVAADRRGRKDEDFPD